MLEQIRDTIVGHLENDEDAGEDRIAKKARIEKIEPMEVVRYFTVDFHQILKKMESVNLQSMRGEMITTMSLIRNLFVFLKS